METVKKITEIDPHQLRVWDRLELIFGSTGEESIYLARVQDITETHVTVDRPIWLSGAPAMMAGAKFTATFMRADACYSFHSELFEEVQSPPHGWKIAPPEDVIRNQRRRSYRLQVNLPVTLTPIFASGEAGLRGMVGRIIDLSTCSMRLEAPVPLDEEQLVLVRLEITESEHELATVGRVKRVCEEGGSDCEYGVEFYTSRELQQQLSTSEWGTIPDAYKHFGERERTALANYLFAEQVRLRQRGLL